MAKVEPDCCRHCGAFTPCLALVEPKHRALGLGHCAHDARGYAYVHLSHCCPQYHPNARRQGMLAAYSTLSNKGAPP